MDSLHRRDAPRRRPGKSSPAREGALASQSVLEEERRIEVGRDAEVSLRAQGEGGYQMKFEEVDEIMKKISMGQYPEEPIVPTAEPFINTSGSISNLCWIPVASVSAIGSVAGSVRSNHYHQTDWHFIYVTDGLMYYYWRGANSLATPSRRRCPPGTLIFTPPLVEHATFFPT